MAANSTADYQNIMASLETRDLPPMIILDVTNVCNLKCIHCPQPQIQAAEGFRAKHLSFATFESMVKQLAQCSSPSLLRFVGDGEPMLHPRLLEMIELARRETNCVINLTTNGTRLTQQAASRLIQANVQMVDISLDGLTKPVYEAVRKGGRYETVMRNVFNLIAMRNEQRSATRVLVSFVRQDENEREVDDFRDFWSPIVDYVIVRNLHSANNRVKQEESRRRNHASQTDRYPCPHLWKRLVVDFEGRIKFCPTDWGTGSVIGKLPEIGLAEAWQRVRVLREQHRTACIPEDSICGPCTDWASTPWDQGYERVVDALVYGEPKLLPYVPLLNVVRHTPKTQRDLQVLNPGSIEA